MTQHGTQQPPEHITSLPKVCVLHATDPCGMFLPPSYLSARAVFPIDAEGKQTLSNKMVSRYPKGQTLVFFVFCFLLLSDLIHSTFIMLHLI